MVIQIIFKSFSNCLSNSLRTLIVFFRDITKHVGNSFVLIKYKLDVQINLPCQQSGIWIIINEANNYY